MITLSGAIIEDLTPDQIAKVGAIKEKFQAPIRDDFKMGYYFRTGFPPLPNPLLDPKDENSPDNPEYWKAIEDYKKSGEWGQWLWFGVDAKGPALDERRIGNFAAIGLLDKVNEDMIQKSEIGLVASIDEAVKAHKETNLK